MCYSITVLRGLPLKLMKSYLLDRTQCAKIAGSTSKHAPITCVVPQGGVLGPLLFLAYIKDIHKSDSEASFHLFCGGHKSFLCWEKHKKIRSKS